MTIPELVRKAVARTEAEMVAVPGVNEASDPFDAPHTIDLNIKFDNRDDDWRKHRAEQWCRFKTKVRWFRRIFADQGVARFEFEDLKDATMFWLAH